MITSMQISTIDQVIKLLKLFRRVILRLESEVVSGFFSLKNFVTRCRQILQIMKNSSIVRRIEITFSVITDKSNFAKKLRITSPILS